MFLFDKAYHLIRYFLLIGIAAFVWYEFDGAQTFSFILMGPSIYLAHSLKMLLSSFGIMMFLEAIPTSILNDYVLLLPVTLVYFFSLGFLAKQLKKEQGWIRYFSMIALICFVVFIHARAWSYLSDYLATSI